MFNYIICCHACIVCLRSVSQFIDTCYVIYHDYLLDFVGLILHLVFEGNIVQKLKVVALGT